MSIVSIKPIKGIIKMERNLKLKRRRLELGLTMLDVAKLVGVSEATISRWESGDIANMRRDKIVKLAMALKVQPGFIMDDDIISDNKSSGVKIPVLGTVRAGIPIDAIEEILDYEEISQDMAAQGDYFALKIKGDSMEPRITQDDVVIVRKQSDVDTGDIAIVLVNGDEATVKKIRKQQDGISLIPTNAKYDIMFYTNSEIESKPVNIIGKVVELRAKF